MRYSWSQCDILSLSLSPREFQNQLDNKQNAIETKSECFHLIFICIAFTMEYGQLLQFSLRLTSGCTVQPVRWTLSSERTIFIIRMRFQQLNGIYFEKEYSWACSCISISTGKFEIRSKAQLIHFECIGALIFEFPMDFMRNRSFQANSNLLSALFHVCLRQFWVKFICKMPLWPISFERLKEKLISWNML